jgi:predicted transcriptional regulator of viral defense system
MLQYVGTYYHLPTFRMQLAHPDKLMRLIKHAGVLRARDLDQHGIPRTSLRILEDKGLIRKVARGLYVAEGTDVTEEHSYAEASKAVPHAVICLLSALRMHGLTTQAPFEVWMAIDVKARKPNIEYPPLRIVRFSGPALTEGMQERTIEGVTVKLYSPAKTVADCFKFRNKIGLDVALEALRECLRQRKATRDEIHHMAQVCRVANVMRPYMESLT